MGASARRCGICGLVHKRTIPQKAGPVGFKRLLGGLRCAIEKVHNARPQTVLGTDDQQSVAFNEALENGRPVAQMVCRSPDVRAHGVCHEGLRVLAKWRGQQGLHGWSDPVDDGPQTGRLMGRCLA